MAGVWAVQGAGVLLAGAVSLRHGWGAEQGGQKDAEAEDEDIPGPGGALRVKKMVPHPSVLAGRAPRTEEPGRLQSVGSQHVRHDRAPHTCGWRRERIHVSPGAGASGRFLLQRTHQKPVREGEGSSGPRPCGYPRTSGGGGHRSQASEAVSWLQADPGSPQRRRRGGLCLPVKGPRSPAGLQGWGRVHQGPRRLTPGRASPPNPRPTLCPLPCSTSPAPTSGHSVPRQRWASETGNACRTAGFLSVSVSAS